MRHPGILTDFLFPNLVDKPMSPHDKPTDPAPQGKRWPAHAKVRLTGMVILVGGLLAAIVVYLIAGSDAGADLNGMDASKQYQFQLERIGGKSVVLASDFNQWLGSLWHGTRLAWTLGVLAVAIALFCFWLAGLMAVEIPEDDTPD